LQLEREKNTQDRHLETLRQQLDAETTKRGQLEKLVSSQKQELVQLRDKNIKFDRDVNKLLTDLKNREWEVKQLESRQDKTIVEHVHVLEEAKRVTDRQLADARKELESQSAYIRSLEKTKLRLAGEAEDLARATEKEHVQLRSREKAFRALEEKTNRAVLDAENERRGREANEAHVRKLQSDLQSTRDQVTDVTQQLLAVQRAKDNLETDLARLADETEASNSMAKVQRQYETRISQLESQLEEAEMAKTTAARIREHMDRQHAEIRRLILSPGPHDDQFRDKLLRELQFSEEQIEKELRSRSRSSGAHVLSNVTPNKRTSMNGSVRARVESLNSMPSPRKSEVQVSTLKQQVQVLELKMAASDRVRQHLEASLRELTADLENSDGSKQSLQQYKARLAKENSRLNELLEDEAEARRHAEVAQLNGIQEIWNKFQNTIDTERESYARLEESRKALVSEPLNAAIRTYTYIFIQILQQKNAQHEVEEQRRQNQEFSQTKRKLMAEITELNERLEAEVLAKKEETSMFLIICYSKLISRIDSCQAKRPGASARARSDIDVLE
jgi:myosin heavy chain 9/10/11/14